MDEMVNEDQQAEPRKRLTPIDVQQKVFRRASFRGYHEQDVDDFLDDVTEELALMLDEVRQLRERSGMEPFAAGSGGGDTSDALRTADDIVRQAREEAAEILRRARTEAAAAGGGGSGLQPFLSQERTFLQDLSKLIQGHADTVRDMARSRRSAPPTAAAPAEAGAASDDTETVEVGEAEASEPAEDRA